MGLLAWDLGGIMRALAALFLLAGLAQVHCYHLKHLDVSAATVGVSGLSHVTWFDSSLFALEASQNRVHRWSVSSLGSLSGHGSASHSRLSAVSSVVALGTNDVAGAPPYVHCDLGSGSGSLSMSCQYYGSTSSKSGYGWLVTRASSAAQTWAFVKANQGSSTYFYADLMDNQGSSVLQLNNNGQAMSNILDAACTAAGECLWATSNTCGHYLPWLWDSSASKMLTTDGLDFPSSLSCGAVSFSLSDGASLGPASQVVACDTAFFLDAAVNSQSGHLVQISAAHIRGLGAGTSVVGTHHSTITSSTNLGIGCIGSRVAVATNDNVFLFDIVSGTSIATSSSISFVSNTVEPSAIATFGSSFFVTDFSAGTLHGVLLIPSVTAQSGNVQCVSTAGGDVCTATVQSLDDFSASVTVDSLYAWTGAVTDDADAPNVAIAISSGGSGGSGASTMTFSVTGVTYSDTAASIVVTLSSGGNAVVAFEFKVVILRAKLVVPSLPVATISMGDTQFLDVSFDNDASSTRALDVEVATQPADTWVALKHPVTNADVASLSSSNVAAGDSMLVRVAISGVAPGWQVFTLTVTSNDIVQPTLVMSWDVNVLAARLLAVFPRQGSKAEAQIQAAQELMPGQRSPAFTLSFVNLITSDVTVTLTFPDVAWLRQYSGDAVVVVEGGDIANVEVQFTHVVNETSPLALGEHTASITLNVTAGSGSFELWYADTTFKAAAGFVAASQCIVRFGDDAQQSAVPSDLRVGETLAITVFLRDIVGHSTQAADTGKVRSSDLVATLSITPPGHPVAETVVAESVVAFGEDGDAFTLHIVPARQGDHQLQVSVLSNLIAGGSVTVPVGARLCPGEGSEQTSSGAACTCAKGYYAVDAAENPATPSCAACAAGSVKTLVGNAPCTQCGAGYKATDATLECEECPAGWVAAPGSTSCTSCGTATSTGKQPSSDRTECLCAAGWYINGTLDGVATCALCPAGQVQSDLHQSGCTQCPAQTHASANRTVCLPCPDGTYNAGGWEECISCPSGQYIDIEEQGCVQCPVGQTSSDPAATLCTTCNPGFVTVGTLATECTPCEGGTKANAAHSACEVCPAGRYSGDEATDCLACAPGHVTAGSSASSCTPCGNGTIANADLNVCTPCGAGTYSGIAATECLACSPGSVTVKPAAGSCSLCPNGTKANAELNQCELCPAGRYSGDGSTQCKACPDGYVTEGAGASGCEPCVNGTRANVKLNLCEPCTAGTYSGLASLTCTSCEPGEVTFGTPPIGCTPCPNGTKANADLNVCETCLGGTHAPSWASDTCTACPDGHITIDMTPAPTWNGIVQGPTTCIPCPAGTYAVRGVECRACDFNFISKPAAKTCTPCTLGTWSQDGLTCHGCPPGTFQAGVGKECSLCPSGHVNAEWNQTTCTACDPFTVPNAERIACTSCKLGTFALDNIECRSCEPGTYNVLANATQCTKCPVGHIARLPGMGACTPCAPGFFASSTGLDACTQCKADHFSTAGAAVCIPCPGLDVTSGAVTTGVKCSGGSVTYEPGFWRPPSSLAEGVKPDTVFHQCVPGACITDEQHGNVTCATGQRGPLCAVCEEGYAPAGQLCAKCWSPAASYAATIAAVMAVSFILAVMVRRSTGHRSELMAVCRIMLNWLQLTSALGTFALKAPEVASDMLNLSSASDGISLNAFFVQCAVQFTYYSLYASYCAFPFVTVGLVGLVCTTGYWIQVWRQKPNASRRSRLRRQFTDWFKMASTVMVCVSYVKVSREILGLFELYTPAIDGTFYLKGDMSVAAFTPEHITAMVVGVVMVIVYIAGVPAGTAAMLHQAKRKIINNSPTFRRKYGFLFDGYDAERGWYWWEAVVMLRKVLVTSIAVFINDGFFQTYAAAMLVTTALVAQAWVSPFESDLHNNLELVSLISSQITQMGSIVYWRFPERGLTITLALVGVNCVTALIFLLAMVYVSRKKVSFAKDVLAKLKSGKASRKRRRRRRSSGLPGGLRASTMQQAAAVAKQKRRRRARPANGSPAPADSLGELAYSSNPLFGNSEGDNPAPGHAAGAVLSPRRRARQAEKEDAELNSLAAAVTSMDWSGMTPNPARGQAPRRQRRGRGGGAKAHGSRAAFKPSATKGTRSSAES